MAKDSVQKRLETGLSFTEFTYQLVQGYDFYWLNAHKDCKLQMGGSDQWGNIVTGTELIRRKSGGAAFALTTKLITKADGTKFGKSEGGNIWLDPKKTSPYAFYQFWTNISDADAPNFIRIFTQFSREEIDALIADSASDPRQLKHALAKDITIRVHSLEEYEKAVWISGVLFGKATIDELKTLDEQTILEGFDGLRQSTITKADFETCANVTDLLSVVTNQVIFSSKGEARRKIQEGGVSINKTKVTDANQATSFELLHGKYLLAQKGKKEYILIIVV